MRKIRYDETIECSDCLGLGHSYSEEDYDECLGAEHCNTCDGSGEMPLQEYIDNQY